MNISEFFASIGFKIEGADELKAVETMLKNMAASAKATVAAVAQLNGMKVTAPQPGATAPAGPGVTAPTAPAQPPTGPGSSQYAQPIGPPVAAFLAYKQAILAASKAKQQLIANINATREAAQKGALAIGAFTAGLVAMAVTAARTAQTLRNFTTATGLSAQEMQRWSAQARILGADGNEMLQTVKAIQSNMARIALGEGDIAPFQFFGIPPDIRKDTFEFMEELRARIQSVGDNPAALAIVREMAGRLGISDDIFQMLRRQRKELDRSLFLTESEVNSIDDMRMSWSRVAQAIGAFKDKFIAAFAEPLQAAAKVLEFITVRLVRFVEWLNQGGVIANTVKLVIGALIVGVVALGVGLAVLASTLTLVVAGFTLWTKALLIFTPAIWAAFTPVLILTAKILAVIAAIAAAVLMIEDLWTGLRGGDSVLMNAAGGWLKYAFGIFYVLRVLSTLVDAFNWVRDAASNMVSALTDMIPDWMKGFFGGNVEVSGNGAQADPMRSFEDMALTPRQPSGGSTANQNNEIRVEVNGAQNPAETGREVAMNIRQTISDAAYQMPALSY